MRCRLDAPGSELLLHLMHKHAADVEVLDLGGVGEVTVEQQPEQPHPGRRRAGGELRCQGKIPVCVRVEDRVPSMGRCERGFATAGAMRGRQTSLPAASLKVNVGSLS